MQILIIITVIIIIITIINVFNLRYNKSCKTEVPGAYKRINACTLIKSSVPKRTYLSNGTRADCDRLL